MGGRLEGESQAKGADQYLNFYIPADGPNPQTTHETRNLWGMADVFELTIYSRTPHNRYPLCGHPKLWVMRGYGLGEVCYK